MKFSGVGFSLVGVFLFPLVFANDAAGAPKIGGVALEGETLTVRGSGFGGKEKPYPVLWAFGSDVRENGVKKNKEVNAVTGESVPVGLDPVLNVWSRGEGAKFSDITRLPEITHSYRAEGDGWLGWPLAFGADDTPFSDKAYVAWRIRVDGDIASYMTVFAEAISGSFLTGPTPFTPGEVVRVIPNGTSDRTGRVVFYDNDKSLLHLEVNGLNMSHFNNAKVIGSESGAEAILDSSVFYRAASASKYFRSYETVNSAGTHVVLSTNRLISAQYSNEGKELRRSYELEGGAGYGVPKISAGNGWQLIEAYIDISGDYGEGYIQVNNEDLKSFNGLYVKDSKPMDAGPTISNIGWEAAGGVELINVGMNFGEIYFDKTPQRVVLSNWKQYQDSGRNIELQPVTSWSDGEISVSVRVGGLDDEKPIYVHVFDENNVSNEVGVCFLNCPGNAPPEKVNLTVD